MTDPTDTQVVEPDVDDTSSDAVAEPDLDNVAEPDFADDATAKPSVEPLSPEMLQRAESYGLPQSDLEGMDTGRLDRMFAAIDRRIMQPQTAGVPGAAPQGGPPMSVPAGGYTPLKIDFGSDLDESVVGPIKMVVDHLNKQMQEAHVFRHHALQELQAMNVLREFGDFDRFVSGLGEEWTSVYGSGATEDLNPDSAEFQKRLEVFHGGKNLLGDAQRRRQKMTRSDSLLRSHHAVHWDRIAEHEQKKLNGKIEQRRQGFTERPTKGRPSAMSPRDSAIAAWNK